MGGGILSYLQDILGEGDSVLVNKKEWGDSVRGGFCRDTSYLQEFLKMTCINQSFIFSKRDCKCALCESDKADERLVMSVHRSIRYKVACTYTCINERGSWLWNYVDRHSTAEMSDNCVSRFASLVRSSSDPK